MNEFFESTQMLGVELQTMRTVSVFPDQHPLVFVVGPNVRLCILALRILVMQWGRNHSDMLIELEK